MQKRNEQGVGLVVFAVIGLALLFVATAIFAAVAYKDRNHYKNDSDKIVAAAVETAKQQQAQTDQKQFDEDSKKPYKTYKGPEAFGSVSFQYPKTWSAYVDESNNSEPINGYFYPDIVPGATSGQAYALRVELINTDYAQVLQQFNSKIKQGTIKAVAYLPPKMKNVGDAQVGTMFRGAIGNGQKLQGQMLVIKVRDKTLEIAAQTNVFAADFSNVILKSLTFNP